MCPFLSRHCVRLQDKRGQWLILKLCMTLSTLNFENCGNEKADCEGGVGGGVKSLCLFPDEVHVGGAGDCSRSWVSL